MGLDGTEKIASPAFHLTTTLGNMSNQSPDNVVGRNATRLLITPMRRITSHFLRAHSGPPPATDRPTLDIQTTGIGNLNSPRSLDGAGSPTPNSPSPLRGRFQTIPELFQKYIEGDQEAKLPEDEHKDATGGVYIPHMQIEAVQAFKEFQARTQILLSKLRGLHDEVQNLGSSLDLAHSAKNLQACVSRTALSIKEKFQKLYPSAFDFSASSVLLETPHTSDPNETTPATKFGQSPDSNANMSDETYSKNKAAFELDVEFLELASRMENFRNSLQHFPEFEDVQNLPLIHLECDLKYWSSNLSSFKGESKAFMRETAAIYTYSGLLLAHFETNEVRLYICDLSCELGERFEELSNHVQYYVTHVPHIRSSQQYAISNLQSLATVATFFSAVTATTIQYSIDNSNKNGFTETAIGLWFISLVFSISSALNSTIALMWRSANYSAPKVKLPPWLWMWIRRCPSIFLLVSVLCFLFGLGSFAISSQRRLVWISVVICECISAFSITVLLLLLLVDKWSQYRLYRLQKRRKGQGSISTSLPKTRSKSLLPTHIEHTASLTRSYFSMFLETLSLLTNRVIIMLRDQSTPILTDSKIGGEPIDNAPVVERQVPSHEDAIPDPERSAAARLLWQRLKNKVMAVVRMEQHKGRDQMKAFEGRLKTISVIEGCGYHHPAGASMSSIAFHPEGKELAMCGKRLTSLHDRQSCELKDELQHMMGIARQVVWTHCGKYVLTRTNRAVYVWHLSSENRTKRIITRPDTSRFIVSIPTPSNATEVGISKEMASKPNPPAFLSVEGTQANKIVIVDIEGQVKIHHEFSTKMTIRHADVLPNGTRALLGVEVRYGEDGIKTFNRASISRRLVLFNLKTKEIEHEVPLWHDLQYVTISRDGYKVAITYKGSKPPQLWKLEHINKDEMRLKFDRQLCSKAHGSISQIEPDSESVQFTGQTHFLHHDCFLICATTSGKLYFWRRDRSDPVHIISYITAAKDTPEEIACDYISNSFRFATRSKEGQIRMWRASPSPLPVIESSVNSSMDDRGQNINSLQTNTLQIQFTESPSQEFAPPLPGPGGS